MTDVELLPLPWCLCHFHDETQLAIKEYARANLAPLQAENKRLRAEVEALKSDLSDYMQAANYQATRAERLAEALREIRRDALDGCSAMDCAREAYDALAQEDRND